MRLKCDVWSGGIYRSLSLKKSTGRKEDRTERGDGWGDGATSEAESPEELHSYLRRFSNTDSHLRPVLHVETARMSIKLFNQPFVCRVCLRNTGLNAARLRRDAARGVVARGTDTEFNKLSPHSHRPDLTSPPNRLPHFKYSVFSFFISL